MANSLTNVARALIEQGAGLGWGDEAEALARAKANNTSYEDELAKIRGEYASFGQEYPMLAPSLEFAGGLMPAGIAALTSGGAATPVAARALAGPLSRVAGALGKGIGAGALTGGIAGAGSAEPGERTMGAATGAGMGGVLGGAVPLLGRTAGSVLTAIKNKMGMSPEAVDELASQKLLRAFEDENLSPGRLFDLRVLHSDIGGPEYRLAFDLPQLAEAVAQRPGASSRIMRESLEPVSQGGRYRIWQRVEKGVTDKNFYDSEDEIVKKLSRIGDDYRQKAYAFGEVDDPVIGDLLEQPEFASYFDDAQKLAKLDQSRAKARGQDPDQYKLRPLYKITMQDGKETVERESVVPDVRTLDYIKRAMDQRVNSLFRSGNTMEAQSLKDLRNAFRDKIDEATTVDGKSAYAETRRKYADELENREALLRGKEDFLGMDPEQLQKQIAGMSETEREAFLTGATHSLRGLLMKPSQEKNFAKILLAPQTRAKMRMLFDSPEAYSLFDAALKREAQLFGRVNDIVRGSQTARRMAGREQLEDDPNILLSMVDTNVGGIFNNLTQTALDAIKGGKMPDRVAARVAGLLTSTDPEQVSAAVNMMERYSQKAAKAERALSTKELAVGRAASATAPSTPEEPEPPRTPGSLMEELMRDSEKKPRTRDLLKELEEEKNP